MKDKFLAENQWRSVILPNSGTSFSTNSPFGIIGKGPHFAFAWAGVPSCVSGPSIPIGTIFGSRLGEKTIPIKTDEWLVFWSDKNGSILVKDVKENEKIPDHHSQGIPSAFKNAPTTIKDLFQSIGTV